MMAVVHDERLRRVLLQIPRFLSADVPLEVKLDELAIVAAGVLEADSAGVTVLDVGGPTVGRMVVRSEGHHYRDELDQALLFERVMHSGATVPFPGAQGASGLAVRLRGDFEPFGAVFVTRNSEHGPWTTEDADLLEFFAQVLAAPVEHGVRLRVAQRATRWMRAAAEFTAELLKNQMQEPVRMICDLAMELAEADSVEVLLARSDPDSVLVRYSRGQGSDHLTGTILPKDQTLAAQVLEDGKARLLEDFDLRHGPATRADGLPYGPLIAVPLSADKDEILGVLVLMREQGSTLFTHAHLEAAETFATTATLAMELAAGRESEEQLTLLEERNRIARDLHDNVVQRLFATGLYLYQAAPELEGKQRQRVDEAIIAIDQTIRQIRNTILVLRSTVADRLDEMVTSIVTEAEPLLGFSPTFSMDPRAREVSGPLAADLSLCVREAISNAVKHAKASALRVEVEVADDVVRVLVADDGIGIQSDRRSGLANVSDRARVHGGTLEITSAPGEGTTLEWRIPLHHHG